MAKGILVPRWPFIVAFALLFTVCYVTAAPTWIWFVGGALAGIGGSWFGNRALSAAQRDEPKAISRSRGRGGDGS